MPLREKLKKIAGSFSWRCSVSTRLSKFLYCTGEAETSGAGAGAGARAVMGQETNDFYLRVVFTIVTLGAGNPTD